MTYTAPFIVVRLQHCLAPLSSRARSNLGLLLSVFLASGCASTGSNSLADLPALAGAAAAARMNALVERRYEDAYAYLSEGSKATLSLERYTRQAANVPISGFAIERTTCAERRCRVQMQIEVQMQIPRVGKRAEMLPREENWIYERGKMVFVIQN